MCEIPKSDSSAKTKVGEKKFRSIGITSVFFAAGYPFETLKGPHPLNTIKQISIC
jgi:hypothetical protein